MYGKYFLEMEYYCNLNYSSDDNDYGVNYQLVVVLIIIVKINGY